MIVESYTPTERLKPYIKTYLIIESKMELINRVLPDTSLAIAFRFKGKVNYINSASTSALPTAVISGLRKSVRLINYLPETSAILILFKEAGATAFFKEPLHELFEQSVSLDNFITQHKTSIIEEQLAEAENNHQRVSVIETFLLSELWNFNLDKLIFSAIQKIQSTNGIVIIKELADIFCLSLDAFEKRFRKAVGSSPKQYASIMRMKSIINSKTSHQTFTDMATGAEYFDQSHFNKDFKLFTGQTPTDFFKAPSVW